MLNKSIMLKNSCDSEVEYWVLGALGSIGSSDIPRISFEPGIFHIPERLNDTWVIINHQNLSIEERLLTFESQEIIWNSCFIKQFFFSFHKISIQEI